MLEDDLLGFLPIGKVSFENFFPSKNIYWSWTIGGNFFQALKKWSRVRGCRLWEVDLLRSWIYFLLFLVWLCMRMSLKNSGKQKLNQKYICNIQPKHISAPRGSPSFSQTYSIYLFSILVWFIYLTSCCLNLIPVRSCFHWQQLTGEEMTLVNAPCVWHLVCSFLLLPWQCLWLTSLF